MEKKKGSQDKNTKAIKKIKADLQKVSDALKLYSFVVNCN